MHAKCKKAFKKLYANTQSGTTTHILREPEKRYNILIIFLKLNIKQKKECKLGL